MFGRKTASAAEPTVIGRGAVVEGKVRASGPIQIDGHIDGALDVEGQVSIGPNGAISGEVTADDVVVGGRIEGMVHARGHLHVASGGSVRGEARYGSLQIDRGGLIDGTTAQGQVTAGTPTPTQARPAEEPSGVRATAALSGSAAAPTSAAAPQARLPRAAS
jgi:cytoskeletal protein CcmA (bactofilin family)